MKKLVASLALLGLIGAGCPGAPANVPQGQKKAVPAASRMGFGKLPAMGAAGALGSPEAISARPQAAPMAVATPMTASANAVITDMKIARPVPQPPNLKPVGIKYEVTAALPEWGTESDVLEVARAHTDAAMVRAFAGNAGLPGPIVSGISEIQSVQVSWKDRDGFVWSTDGASGMLNWWKNQDMVQPMMADTGREAQIAPTVADPKIIAAADAFLRSHGLGSVAEQGASVEQHGNQPCLMKAEMAADATTMIYPSPCGYYQTQATVYYGANREGKPVVDMGGWPSRMSSVSVDLKTMQVVGGNVIYVENISRSAYPLLDKATVAKRLQEGGRNPVYPWGNETRDVQVTIDQVELAWLRFDSWVDGVQQTYYIPAIAASGKVVRGIAGQPDEEYHTTVALVKDDAFISP